MKQFILILPAAEDDLDAGRRYYERREKGLGGYFLDSLGSDIDALLFHGGVHRVVYRFHRCPSKLFPYAIFYRVAGETIRIYAVLDCRRSPAAIRRDLRRR